MKHRLTVLLITLAGLATPLAAESLYDEHSFRPLAADKRAHLPGDSLTVLIYENASATTSVGTNMNRKNNVAVQGAVDERQHGASVGLNNQFDGGGSSQRTGKLLAQMTVSVDKVAANGELWISGEQLLEINADKQKIRVEGRVRPLDISDSNTVFSYRIADARISYLGDGDLAARQRPGFWSKLFVWAGF
ncbi:flagellar basal body L-ring protein FlgH [Chitinimonas sp.]|uniref:flagellar basal body L-ring protein FlgH n=1 Tax=Chitinimonas sp. TaxID=1934313 RepID=UPI0035AE503E